jgi:type II secretory pathway pseudopilin PulG
LASNPLRNPVYIFIALIQTFKQRGYRSATNNRLRGESGQRGFAFVEALVVLAISALMIGYVGPRVF